MRTAPLVLFLFTALSLAASDDVSFTEKKRDVEFCKPLGSVKAKSGWGGSAGCDIGIKRVKDTLAKRAAALGANYVLLEDISCGPLGANGGGQAYACSAESLEKQRETQASANQEASKEIRCEAGSDCEMKWSRVTQWLLDHSDWKFRNVTDTLITTEGPLDTAKPAYEVVKIPAGDGKTYLIKMRASCGEGIDCEERILASRISFGQFVRGETASQ